MFADRDRLENRWRLDPADLFHGVRCDKGGPSIGPVRLLQRKAAGWEPRPIAELNLILRTKVDYPIDFSTRRDGLAAVAHAMNEDDLARAIFCTLHMRLVPLNDAGAALRAMEADWLAKASPDDPDHPGWPAGAPDRKGGEFRTKTGEERSLVPTANWSSGLPQASGKSEAMDAALRRALRFSLIAQLKAWNEQIEAVDALVFPHDHWNYMQQAQEKLKHVNNALLLDNVAMILISVREANVKVDAAVTFAAGGPRTLEELRVSNEDLGFPSMGAFVKIDVEEIADLEKRFGPAPAARLRISSSLRANHKCRSSRSRTAAQHPEYYRATVPFACRSQCRHVLFNRERRRENCRAEMVENAVFRSAMATWCRYAAKIGHC